MGGKMERKWIEHQKRNDTGKRKYTNGVRNSLRMMALAILLIGNTAVAAPEHKAVLLEENTEHLTDTDLKEQRGEIRIHLTDGKAGTSKENIRFYCVKVADIQNGEYVLTEVFRDSGVEINAIQNSNDLADSAKRFSECEIPETTVRKEAVTDSAGNAVIRDMEAGVYLVFAEDCENYDTISPTLAAIPEWTEQTGEMAYEIELLPKHNEKTESSAKTAPQTGLRDHTGMYLAGAAVCFTGAMIFMYISADKSKRRRKNG
jgi:hypothetical protein